MILVVGATGSLGGRITRGLREQGKAVRILARRNSPSEELAKQGRANTVGSLIEAGCDVVYGDLKDPASLDAACRGAETVITTATATQRWGEDTIETVDLHGTLALIRAATGAGVQRFMYTSVLGASRESPNPLFRIKAACEAELEKSGMAYTILQPSVFMEIWIGMVVGLPLMAGQPVTLIGKGDHHQNFISEADVAAFALAALDRPGALNQRLLLGGPDSYTWTEVVNHASKAIGSEVPICYVPPGSTVSFLPPGVSDLFSSMEFFETYIDMRETAPAYGVTLTTLEEFSQRAFGRYAEAARAHGHAEKA